MESSNDFLQCENQNNTILFLKLLEHAFSHNFVLKMCLQINLI